MFEVAAARATQRLERVARHMVDRPRRIGVDSRTMLAPMRTVVDANNGVRTVIRIDRDADISS